MGPGLVRTTVVRRRNTRARSQRQYRPRQRGEKATGGTDVLVERTAVVPLRRKFYAANRRKFYAANPHLHRRKFYAANPSLAAEEIAPGVVEWEYEGAATPAETVGAAASFVADGGGTSVVVREQTVPALANYDGKDLQTFIECVDVWRGDCAKVHRRKFYAANPSLEFSFLRSYVDVKSRGREIKVKLLL